MFRRRRSLDEVHMPTTTRRVLAISAALLLLAAAGWRLLPGGLPTAEGTGGERAIAPRAPGADPETAGPLTRPWAVPTGTPDEPGAGGLAGEVVDAISGAPIPGA